MDQAVTSSRVRALRRFPSAVLAVLSCGSLITVPATSQPSPAGLKPAAADMSALIEAENNKSPVCRGYQGKVVAPLSFDAYERLLTAAGAKGEYETTAQYRARQIAATGPAGSVVLLIPIDRDYVRYNADAGAMTVQAGAFSANGFGKDEDGETVINLMLSRAKVDELVPVHPGIMVSAVDRIVSRVLGRSGLGIPVPITNIEQTVKGLSLTGDRLFSFAADDDSIVAGYPVSATLAARSKAALRVALVVQAVPPNVVKDVDQGLSPTAQRPVQRTYRTTIIVARARCGLVLDGQMRVLASTDASGADK